MQAGQSLRRKVHPGRLVALASIGRRSQPGRVGFDQNSVQGKARGDVAERLGLRIGQIAGKGDEKTQVKRAGGLFVVSTEAVHNAAETCGLPMFLQNQEEIVPGVGGVVSWPAVNQDGPLSSGGYFQ